MTICTRPAGLSSSSAVAKDMCVAAPWRQHGIANHRLPHLAVRAPRPIVENRFDDWGAHASACYRGKCLVSRVGSSYTDRFTASGFPRVSCVLSVCTKSGCRRAGVYLPLSSSLRMRLPLHSRAKQPDQCFIIDWLGQMVVEPSLGRPEAIRRQSVPGDGYQNHVSIGSGFT